MLTASPTIVITGGAAGIGAATAQRLKADGANVITVDIQGADIIADLSTEAGREAAVAAIGAAAPEGIDGLVPCAGLGPSVRPFSLVAKVNYFGTTALVEGLKPLLAKRKGAVVLISSNSAPMGADVEYVDALLAGDEAVACARIDGLDGHNAYAGSKLAITRWMRRNSTAFAQAGIRLNAVAPGITKTALTDKVFDDDTLGQAMRDFQETVPLGQMAVPEQIASSICFLLSSAADFIAGSVLFVDGGHDAMLRPDQF